MNVDEVLSRFGLEWARCAGAVIRVMVRIWLKRRGAVGFYYRDYGKISAEYILRFVVYVDGSVEVSCK